MPATASQPDPVWDLFLLTHRAIVDGIDPDPNDPHTLFQLAYIAHEIGLKRFPIPKKVGQQFLEYLQRTAPEIAGSRPVTVPISLQRGFDHGELRSVYEEQLQYFQLLADQEAGITQAVTLIITNPLGSVEALVNSVAVILEDILKENKFKAKEFGLVASTAKKPDISVLDCEAMAAIIDEFGILNTPCCKGLDPDCTYQQELLKLRQAQVDTLDFEGPLLLISQQGKTYMFGPVNAEGQRSFHQADAESVAVTLLGSGNEAAWPKPAYPGKIVLGQRLFIIDKRLSSKPVLSGVIVRAQQGVTMPQETN